MELHLINIPGAKQAPALMWMERLSVDALAPGGYNEALKLRLVKP